MGKKKVFISHCENNFEPTDYAISIVDLIGCIPVVAEREPKLSRTVRSLVSDSLDSCDAVIVIATPDHNGSKGKEPSQGVLVEIGQIQKIEKLKDKYVIIKEKSVVFGPMVPEARYKFTMPNYGPIAEAILIELGSMGLFSNYYALPGSDLKIHELMEVLSQLKEWSSKKMISPEIFNSHVEDLIRKTIEEQTKGVF
jgi:Predicted nucleotide-binding protein containing TIR-like domain